VTVSPDGSITIDGEETDVETLDKTKAALASSWDDL
jgi:hypothetical protein